MEMNTNTSTAVQLDMPLGDCALEGRTQINGSVSFVDADGYRVVFRWHEPLYRMALADVVHVRLAAVALRQSKLATQEEIARSFGHSVITQARWERQYQKDGLEGLMPKQRPGRAPQLNKTQDGFVRKWFREGASNCQIAKRLGVDEATIRRTLKRLQLCRKPAALPLPAISNELSAVEAGTVEEPAAAVVEAVAEAAETAPPAAIPVPDLAESCAGDAEPAVAAPPIAASFTLDHDPRDRSGDRCLARMGQLDDAVPLFADGENVPRAGVLLAVPLLVGHGLTEAFTKVYGSLGPSFYGLRTTAVTLFLCALLRIKRPEHLKEYGPEALGALVGLDRAPEVKTVRRKFTRMAAMDRGRQLMEELARQRIAQDEDRVAFLYVDGHVREYRGKFPLFQAKKAQRQVVTPAATDTWVHDAQGQPLLVITSDVNAQLTQVLEPILADVRRLVGDRRRMTAIFDRGGFSAKLFARLIDAGIDVITYRKGKSRKLPREQFVVQREEIDGAERTYEVCDRPRVRVGVLRGKRKHDQGQTGPRYLWMREVRVLRDDDRQTAILSNRQDLTAVQVAYRIFQRWRQENYFQYMAEEFALDALVEYGAEELSEAVDRRNPRWLQLTRQLKKARAEVAQLRSELGEEAAANVEASRPTMRGFKIAHAALRGQLQRAEKRIARLLAQRKNVPPRIPATDRKALRTEKKLIADAIKMAAYQVETQLQGLLQAHYPRCSEEGRTLLHAAFQSPARLEVTDDELRVTIARQSSPHRTAALAALCEQLDALATPFPGTHLRLRLAVQTEKPIIS